MSEFPAAVEANATRFPSGESDEWLIASPGIAVICLAGELRSRGIVQRLRLPVRELLNNRVRPSLDTNVHIGSLVLSRIRTAVRPFRSGSGPAGTFQSSRSVSVVVASRREPSAARLRAPKVPATLKVKRDIEPSWMSRIPRSFAATCRETGT